jgi:hypothetical protein
MAAGMTWMPVCGLESCQPGSRCAGVGWADEALADAGRLEAGMSASLTAEESEPCRQAAASLHRIANRWMMTAAVCELPAVDPRRKVAALLLEAGWHWAPELLTPDEQAAAAAELLDSAAAILVDPGLP